MRYCASRFFKHRLMRQNYRRPPRAPQKLKAGCTHKSRESPHRQSSHGQGVEVNSSPRGNPVVGCCLRQFRSRCAPQTSECALQFLEAVSPPAAHPPVPPSQPDKHHPWVYDPLSRIPIFLKHSPRPSFRRRRRNRWRNPLANIPKQQARRRGRPPKPLAALIHLRLSCGLFPKQPNL